MRQGGGERDTDGGGPGPSADQLASAAKDAADLFGRLRATNAAIESKAGLVDLEPVLDELASYFGAEAMVLAERRDDSLVQRTHLREDRLTGFHDDWATLLENGYYEWSPDERPGQASVFPETPYGRVITISGRRQQESGEISATLTLITGDRPFNQDHAEIVSWITMLLSGLFLRLERAREQARVAELSRLREVTSSRLLPYSDADTDAIQAVTDVLAFIAEGFEADEVIWGNRHQPEAQHSSQRYIRSEGCSRALPSARLLVEGGLDAAPENRAVTSRFSAEALHSLGHNPDEMSSSVAWVTPLRVGPTVIGGLGLLFYAAPHPINENEERFLCDISNLLQQFEVRMRAQRALDKRHRYDELSIEVAQKLLNAAHDTDSTTAVVEWTLGELCLTMGADLAIRQVLGDVESASQSGSPSGLAHAQRLGNTTPALSLQSKIEDVLEKDRVATVSLKDFSEDEQDLLNGMGLAGVWFWLGAGGAAARQEPDVAPAAGGLTWALPAHLLRWPPPPPSSIQAVFLPHPKAASGHSI